MKGDLLPIGILGPRFRNWLALSGNRRWLGLGCLFMRRVGLAEKPSRAPNRSAVRCDMFIVLGGKRPKLRQERHKLPDWDAAPTGAGTSFVSKAINVSRLSVLKHLLFQQCQDWRPPAIIAQGHHNSVLSRASISSVRPPANSSPAFLTRRCVCNYESRYSD